MLVKEDGHMVTARQEPRLVLVSITLENNYLTLEAPGMEQIVLPIKLPSSNKIQDCRLFGLDIKGRDCGNEVAQWFTSYLKTQPYRLVQFDTNMKGRTTKKLYPSESYLQNYEVSVQFPSNLPVTLDSVRPSLSVGDPWKTSVTRPWQ